METVKSAVVGLLKFIGITLLIDLGLFALVSLSCLLGTRCTNVQYSERMFWVGLAAMIAAMPAVLGALGTSRGYYNSPFTAGMDAQVADVIVADGRRSLSRRSAFALRAISVGLVGIGLAAVIDILGRSG